MQQPKKTAYILFPKESETAGCKLELYKKNGRCRTEWNILLMGSEIKHDSASRVWKENFFFNWLGFFNSSDVWEMILKEKETKMYHSLKHPWDKALEM